jgi:hypothetical protein
VTWIDQRERPAGLGWRLVALVVDDRDRVDLDQVLGSGQRLHSHHSVGWLVIAEQACPGMLNDRQVLGPMVNDVDELRARAFLDLLLGKDSRPRQDGAAAPATSPAGAAAGGFVGQVTLTVPLGSYDTEPTRYPI